MTEAYQQDIFGGEAVKVEPRRDGNMAKEFIVPPFSVLDTSQSYWLERKRAWLSLGIKSEVGRGMNLSIDDDHLKEKKGFTRAAPPADAKPLMFDKTQQGLNDMMGGNGFETGTSVFDPVLCELVYRWFCPPACSILDPFAGGSVRGIVAAKLGHLYKGIDLSARQVEANVTQAAQIIPENPPMWFWGDSAQMRENRKIIGLYDFIFSCPPYFDLEVYSGEAGELSAMTWDGFLAAYRDIIASSVFMLRNNRFACFVVGEVRDKNGYYRNFVGETVSAFEAAGAHFYNEAILVTSIGTLPLRAKKYMNSNRKMGKRHQNVLVFVKGDPKQAAKDCGDINAESVIWRTAEIPAAAQADEYIAPEGFADGELYVDNIVANPAGEIQLGATGRDDSPPAAEPAPLFPDIEPAAPTAAPVELTPVERRGSYWVKRDDLYTVAGVNGGKVRSCLALSEDAVGLVTAGSRSSPQVSIVAHIALHLGIPCEGHTPKGELPPLLQHAASLGMQIVQHKAGYNNVISKRAADSAAAAGWTLIPFGMEHEVAVQQTAQQVGNIPGECKRLVIPVGSGMSLAGVLHGLEARIRAGDLSVLGIVVGAKPDKRLDKFAPEGWRELVTLETSILKYDASPRVTELEGLQLDPIYEAKCISFLLPGDCLWVVGIRQLVYQDAPVAPEPIVEVAPRKIEPDKNVTQPKFF
jgi:1-aminocyclopropane-1-carboxylate deaminase/D-cysteine desulfhydrase-like pyridoxal-dependent ACC family enzyme